MASFFIRASKKRKVQAAEVFPGHECGPFPAGVACRPRMRRPEAAASSASRNMAYLFHASAAGQKAPMVTLPGFCHLGSLALLADNNLCKKGNHPLTWDWKFYR